MGLIQIQTPRGQATLTAGVVPLLTRVPERTNHLVGVRKTQIWQLRTKQTPNQALAPVTCSPTFQRRRGWGVPAKGNSLLPNTMTTWTSPGGMQKYLKENYKDR
ncbi:unnamed protein product [Arctogadus glacialis]